MKSGKAMERWCYLRRPVPLPERYRGYRRDSPKEKSMLRLLLVAGLALSGAVAAQTIYKVQTPDGSILFTDSPPAGSKVLEEGFVVQAGAYAGFKACEDDQQRAITTDHAARNRAGPQRPGRRAKGQFARHSDAGDRIG